VLKDVSTESVFYASHKTQGFVELQNFLLADRYDVLQENGMLFGQIGSLSP
jgi:hypothetical protein